MIYSIKDKPEYKNKAVDWFSSKWGIPKIEYEKSFNDAVNGNEPLPQWFFVLNEKDEIIAGCGLIENDFVNRTDIKPFLCALFVEPKYRLQKLASLLLQNARIKGAELGFEKLYLCTNHTTFYEKCGWTHIGFGTHLSGDISRIYEAETISDEKNNIKRKGFKTMDNLTIRLETEKDYEAVENLTREAFWNVYKPGADEHYFVHMMRNHPDFIPELAFVLEKDGEIIGNIMYTKAWLEDENGEKKEILSFGPLCVAPKYQRQKLGKLLIEHSFEKARKMGYDVNINFGNPGNYVSRGFVSCKKKNVSFVREGNFPTALLICELIPGVLDGKKWMYIPSTAADCCENSDAVEEFDSKFPPKEKKWMPSQEEFYIYSHSSVVR